MGQKISYYGSKDSLQANWASAIVAIRVHGDSTPGTLNHYVDVTLDNVDNVMQKLQPTIDSGAGSSAADGWVYFNSDGSPLPVKEFSVTVTGTLTYELAYIAA